MVTWSTSWFTPLGGMAEKVKFFPLLRIRCQKQIFEYTSALLTPNIIATATTVGPNLAGSTRTSSSGKTHQQILPNWLIDVLCVIGLALAAWTLILFGLFLFVAMCMMTKEIFPLLAHVLGF